MKYVNKLLFLIALMTCIQVNAAVERSGKVGKLSIEGGIFKFQICNSTNCKYFWLKPNSDYSNAMLSVILLSKATSKSVWVQGLDVSRNPAPGWPYGSASQISTFNVLD